MRRIVMVLGSVIVASVTHALAFAGPSGEPLDFREVRPKLFGPQIATGKDYTAHSPQAVVTDGKVQCAGPAEPKLSEEEHRKRLDALHAGITAMKDAYWKEVVELKRRRNSKEITEAQFLELVAPLDASYQKRESEALQKNYEEAQRLQQEFRESAQAASGNVGIVLIHSPSDPNATIIPLDQDAAPAPAFLADLNQTLKPFLLSCGDRPNVGVAHYFKDVSLGAGKDFSGQISERQVAGYYYTLRGGLLALNAPDKGTKKFKLFHDAEHNDLTLASINALWEKHALIQANYRKDFSVASKRKPGIVYKLDPYWAAYTADVTVGTYLGGYFDKARRIFDGDFTLINRSQEFRVLFMDYGQLFSQRCEAHVKSFVTYPIPNQDITRTRIYMDGRTEHDYESKPIPFQIDARFDPQWGQWYADRNSYWAQDLLHNLRTARGDKSFSAMSREEFAERTLQFLGMHTKTMMPIEAFFNRHTCTSAAMTQLGENLLRAAQGRPSLQAAGVKLAGADRESDPTQAP